MVGATLCLKCADANDIQINVRRLPTSLSSPIPAFTVSTLTALFVLMVSACASLFSFRFFKYTKLILGVRWANVTLGLPCVVENTPYIAYAGTSEFIDIVSRGNCMVGMYCDAQQKVCVQNKVLNEACQADKECVSSAGNLTRADHWHH